MYLQSVGGRSGNSRSTPENQLQAVSMKSPSWNRLKSTRFEASPSLPGDLLGEFPANGDVEGEIEDTTLYYAAPSLADLTAFASGIIGGLISSASRIFKAPIPEVSAVDLVSLPSQLDIIRPHTAVLNTYEELSKSSAAETQDYITSAPGGSILAPPTCLKRSITAYGIIGTLGRGTYGKVVLGCLKDDFDGDLYAIKIVPKAGTRSNIPELAILEFISNISKIKDGDRDKWGVAFLQRMRETLHSDESFFIVLVRH
ncbi:hypothetical protein H0H81_000039 [Sphagnurus paluster]|uniref:Protein kinase domain-containing protein n=1 Tax=Sphagnurus paluster TaxID=117069 RepID=A0A9P7FWQ2_9AGAR|nr:hypothetical protein H0H81_000039 [Sphagnurus paluster]